LRIVEVTKYKGGQGATLTAAMFALVALEDSGPLAQVLIVSDSLDIFSALALPSPINGSGAYSNERLHVVKVDDKVTRKELEDLAKGFGASYVVTDLAEIIRDVKNSRPLWRSKDVAHELVTVCRPCYMAIRSTLAAKNPNIHHLVTFEEEGRALTVKDLHTVTRPNRITAAKWAPTVARALDAGLLQHRRPAELAGLEAGARTTWAVLALKAADLAGASA